MPDSECPAPASSDLTRREMLCRSGQLAVATSWDWPLRWRRLGHRSARWPVEPGPLNKVSEGRTSPSRSARTVG